MSILTKKFYFDIDNYNVLSKNETNLIISDYYFKWLKTSNTGLDILKYLNGENTLCEVIDRISDEYMLDREVIEKDIIKFCHNALHNGIIEEKGEETYKLEYDNNLREVYIDITSECNLTCIYCNKCNRKETNSEKFMSIERISEILEKTKNFADGNEFTVHITGGEPLLHDKLELILEKVREYSNYVTLWTNGSLIDDNKIKILEKHCTYVYLSIDSFVEDINDSIRGKGSYNQALNASKILNKSGVNFIVATTPNIYNIETLENMFEFAREIGAIGLQMNNPIKKDTNGENLDKYFSYNENRLYEVYTVLSKKSSIINSWKNNNLKGENTKQNMYLIVERYKCLNGLFNIHKKSACGAGSNIISVDVNGDVYPCHCLQIKDLKMGTISNLNKNKPIASIKDLEECNECEYNIICLGGCRAESLYCNNDLLTLSPSCKYIKKMFDDIMWLPMKATDVKVESEV